jgi:excisionase family DNA binding protein
MKAGAIEPLLTRREVAEALRLSLESVRRLTRSGALGSVRIGSRGVRYRPGDVARLIERKPG